MYSIQKRIAALILAAVSGFIFSSCSAPSQTGTPESSSVVSDTTVTVTEAEAEAALNLPEELNYDGYNFVVLTEAGYNWEEVDVDEPQGTVTNDVVVNDAIKARNMAVEELFGITLEMVLTSNMGGDIKKSAAAGDNAYDVAMPSTRTASSLSLDNYFLDWTKTEYIDLTKPWYDAGAVKGVSLGGHIYFMTGRYGFRDMDNTWIFMFNKALLQNLNLEEPYDAVRGGTWTFEYFMSLTENVTMDVDGNGKYDKNDTFGFLTTGAGGATNFLYAGGSKIVSEDADGNLTLCLNTDRTASIVETANNIFNTGERTHTDDWQVIEKMFTAGQGLFYSEIMAHVRNLRGMEADFGILPAPKFDERQETYYTHVDAAAPMMVISSIAPDPDRTSAVVEAMFYYGYKYLRPAYYDVALTNKHIRDDESAEMLDLALSGRVFDLGYIYNVGSFGDMLSTMVGQKNSDFASYYAKNADKAAKALDDITTKLEDLK